MGDQRVLDLDGLAEYVMSSVRRLDKGEISAEELRTKVKAANAVIRIVELKVRVMVLLQENTSTEKTEKTERLLGFGSGK